MESRKWHKTKLKFKALLEERELLKENLEPGEQSQRLVYLNYTLDVEFKEIIDNLNL